MKKRKIISFAVLLLVVAAAGAIMLWKQPFRTTEAPQKTPIRLVAMGDSLTEGIGDEKNQAGYVGILERQLKADRQVTDISVKNYGVMGNKIDQLRSRFGSQPAFRQAVKRANVLTITIGGNDVMKILKSKLLNTKVSDFSTGSKQFQSELKKLLIEIRKTNPRAPIYLVGIYNPYTTYFSEIKEFGEIIKAWNDASADTIKTIPAAHFVPVSSKLETYDKKWKNKANPLLAKDHFHPNHRGYKIIAAELEKAIKKQLRANQLAPAAK